MRENKKAIWTDTAFRELRYWQTGQVKEKHGKQFLKKSQPLVYIYVILWTWSFNALQLVQDLKLQPQLSVLKTNTRMTWNCNKTKAVNIHWVSGFLGRCWRFATILVWTSWEIEFWNSVLAAETSREKQRCLERDNWRSWNVFLCFLLVSNLITHRYDMYTLRLHSSFCPETVHCCSSQVFEVLRLTTTAWHASIRRYH